MAQIVLNELFPNPTGPSSEESEFIELYNLGSESISLNGFVLEDKAGKKFIMTDVTIAPHSYYVLTKAESGIALNNATETVSLKDPSGVLINTFSYTSTVNDKSFSRIPDGIGDFKENTNPTKSEANAPPPEPTALPPEPTPLPSPTLTPKPTVLPTQTAFPTQQVEKEGSILAIEDSNEAEINSMDPTYKISPESDSKSQSFLSYALIGGGAAFIGGSVLYVFKKRKNNDTINAIDNNEKE